MILSERLKKLAECVEYADCIADIGTDHAYLPIALITEKKAGRVIASDLREKPLVRARNNINEAGLSSEIEVRQAYGARGLKPNEAEAVVMSGMGGDLMLKIIADRPEVFKELDAMYLSPQSEIYDFRKGLMKMGYRIEDEWMVEDDHKYYFIIKAVAGHEEEEYRECELYYGRKLLQKGDDIVCECIDNDFRIQNELLEKVVQVGTAGALKRAKEIESKMEMMHEALGIALDSTECMLEKKELEIKMLKEEMLREEMLRDEMLEESMLHITVGTKANEYPRGVHYSDIANDFQGEFDDDILLAFHNHKLTELTSEVREDGAITFITAKDPLGLEAYKRSMVLLFLKAFYHVVGQNNVESVRVQFSVSKGYYIEPVGCKLSPDELEEIPTKVKKFMSELVERDLPINKLSVSTDEAIKLFADLGMHDKERLFYFRRASNVNIYELDGYFDYFYGYMLPSTGLLKYFDLYPYAGGLVLQMPTTKEPKLVPEFKPQDKVSHTLIESAKWSADLGISTVADLNEAIVDGRIQDIILVQEAQQDQKLSDIASRIKANKNIKFIMIAGPSSSGKTTFSHRLSVQLKAHGLKPHPIGVDDYFIDREKTPRDEEGNYNFEDLDSIDVEGFNRDMNDLLAGERIEMPRYNFKTGVREYRGEYLQLGEDDILVIEGIHCLNKALYPHLSDENIFKIYISALTQLNVDEHNRVSTTDGRLIRRMVRDAAHRGITAQETIQRWGSVRRGEEKNIFPYQETADVVFNSAQIYELSVLKAYAEPLLFSVPRDCPEYQEAKRLLKFLDYFLALPETNIPQDSILREFIGGSIFNV